MRKIFIILFLLPIICLSQSDSLINKLSQIKNKYNVAGMSVAVVLNDSLVFLHGFGKRDIPRNLPVDDSTVYRIASISKMITATALMQLYDQGLFNLDDDVNVHLGFSLRNPSFPNDPITIRKVLTHTSSLRDGSGYSSFLSATNNNNPPPHIQTLLTPGSSYYTSNMFASTRSPSSNYFTYANINYGVLGTLIEKLSGKRFDIYCKEKIFEPLGISGSFNIQDISNINNVAVLYRLQNGNWNAQADNYGGVKPPPRNLSNYVIGTNGLIFGPQGSLRISAADLSIFMLAHLNGGVYNSVKILSDSTINLMHNSLWIYNGSNGNNYYGIFNTYGLGCNRTEDLLPGEILFGHPGEAYGLISDMYFSKINDYGIIFITNGGVWGDGTYSGWYNIEEEIYKSCFEHLDDFIVTSIEETFLPDKLNLYQNYPNPFNPITKIRYSIPSDVKSQTSNMGLSVKLVVFDILGSEIVTLVNEPKTPGVYEVEWSGSDYSSGIYLCKLDVNGFTSVKKIILIK